MSKLTATQATALNVFLDFALADDGTDRPTDEAAGFALALLADAAHERLGAGWTAAEVAEAWLDLDWPNRRTA